jgi:hypothetical protein
MSLWGSNTSANTAAPKIVVRPSHKANSHGNQTIYANTTVGAFVNGALLTTNGVLANSSVGSASHSGWRLVTVGTGPVLTISVSAGGTSYVNSDVGIIVSPANSLNGGVNGAFTLTTNSTGGITAVTLTAAGAGFINATPTVTIVNSTAGATTGSTATFTLTVGGRAGRTHSEVLVASGSMTS